MKVSMTFTHGEKEPSARLYRHGDTLYICPDWPTDSDGMLAIYSDGHVSLLKYSLEAYDAVPLTLGEKVTLVLTAE